MHMPARQPFTTLCQTLARKPAAGRADLHVHTTHSDGSYTPAEVVDLARRSGLAALAITDHDTTAAVAEARLRAGEAPGIVSGRGIRAGLHARRFHLLAFFIRVGCCPLPLALDSLRQHSTTCVGEVVK